MKLLLKATVSWIPRLSAILLKKASHYVLFFGIDAKCVIGIIISVFEEQYSLSNFDVTKTSIF
jgi:hypothetical protein